MTPGTQPASDEERVSALASRCALAWIIAVGALANAAAISPLGNRVAEINAWIHDYPAWLTWAASVVVGAGLRDLARTRPWSTPLRLAVAAAGFAIAAAALLPEPACRAPWGPCWEGPSQEPPSAMPSWREAGGRSPLVADSRKSRLKAYAPEVYTPDLLQQWIETGRRQEAKDRVLLPEVARSFAPGTGAGAWRRAGQTSLVLRELGWEVVASDYAQFSSTTFSHSGCRRIASMRPTSRPRSWKRFANVFCQSITPLITSDLEVVFRSYRSIHEALQPGGRMVEIHAQAARHELGSTMRLYAEQARRQALKTYASFATNCCLRAPIGAPLRPLAILAERARGRASRQPLRANGATQPQSRRAPLPARSSEGVPCVVSRAET